tara:strand:- start:27 stop:572 length:546 start_codon:yes stop_codon:yes gene_type:complete
MKLNEKLATIQTKFKSKKSRYNSFGKYNFRSAEDILEATKPYLLELGISVTISERLIVESSQDFPILECTALISDGVDAIHSHAIVGVDLAQKGMQMPQKFGSASSYGKKYALGNLFLIDDTADSDATNSHGKAEKDKPTITSLKDPAFTKAKKYVQGGGKVEAIKAKYKMSDDVIKALTL